MLIGNAFLEEKRIDYSRPNSPLHGMCRHDRSAFKRTGHPVEFWRLEGVGHGWPRGEKEPVWEFFGGGSGGLKGRDVVAQGDALGVFMNWRR
jgi:poly(3-hydroxybutyrate) depolymerase